MVMKVKKGKKKLPRVVHILGQTGSRKSLKLDRSIKALESGKRISKTGKTYWETRRNRSDHPRSSRT